MTTSLVVARHPEGFGVRELVGRRLRNWLCLAYAPPLSGPTFCPSFAELRAWLGTVWGGLRLVPCRVDLPDVVAEIAPAHRYMIARFRGACRTCGKSIRRGDMIAWSSADGATCFACLGGGDS